MTALKKMYWFPGIAQGPNFNVYRKPWYVWVYSRGFKSVCFPLIVPSGEV